MGNDGTGAVSRTKGARTKEFRREASKIGFKGLWLHHPRGSHETALLDASAIAALSKGVLAS
jgi:hypothetical protein